MKTQWFLQRNRHDIAMHKWTASRRVVMQALPPSGAMTAMEIGFGA